ncbi:MAG: hypothetical protein HYX69_01845 [Planctomycetia bacterium]|nr:hypothetical protein [Planctomycetia bacterium]
MHPSDVTDDRQTHGEQPWADHTTREGGLYRLQDVLPELLARYGIETAEVPARPAALYYEMDAAIGAAPAAAAC